jgi:hypothetical protein
MMNDRIKQLAEQAGLRFTQLMSNPMVPVVDGKETDLEKFAELIVKETLQVARAGIEYGPSMEEAVYTYFGVEL